MISYTQWKKEYLFDGKTIPIYLVLVEFIALIVNMYLGHFNIFDVSYSLVGIISSYAVFTDLYAHEWIPKMYDISLKEYIKKIFSFRTHDIYGLIIGIIASFLLNIYLIIVPLALISIGYIVKSRFYH